MILGSQKYPSISSRDDSQIIKTFSEGPLEARVFSLSCPSVCNGVDISGEQQINSACLQTRREDRLFRTNSSRLARISTAASVNTGRRLFFSLVSCRRRRSQEQRRRRQRQCTDVHLSTGEARQDLHSRAAFAERDVLPRCSDSCQGCFFFKSRWLELSRHI